jgi:Flp pilus assembly protein TadD
MRRLDRVDLAFEAGIIELRLRRDPENVALLAAMAEACTRLHRYAEGLALDRRLVALHPDEPVSRYNLACSLALTGDLDGATRELLAAVRLGYRDFDHLALDTDLRRLRRDAGYGALLGRLARIAADAGD